MRFKKLTYDRNLLPNLLPMTKDIDVGEDLGMVNTVDLELTRSHT